jgi:hypothetical protein
MRTKPVRLNGKQMVEALNLFKDSDSVELKLTVTDSDRDSAIAALDLDVLDAELRQVVFFDTPDLKLKRAGLVLRARRARKGGDTVVKLRPIIPAEDPEKLRRSSSFTIEVDAMPGSLVCSGSLKSKASNKEVKDVLLERRPIRKLFLPEQRALFKQHAPRGLDLDSLVPLGPINTARLKFAPPSFKGRAVVAELWFYPDGSRILEISTRCLPDEAFQVAAETREFLIRRGVSVTGEQETKTSKALEHFSHLHTGKILRRA